MIAANELRIGNYYKGASRENTEVVTWETIRDVAKNNLVFVPIRLTEETMSKTNFTNGSGWYYLGGFSWNPFDKGLRYHGCHLGEPDYLHNLQNIIFEISGQEVKFNEI